ncbi:tRNA pseudouridine synthase [Suhomyces tanzawaensis NRRL Y-17324]|uniref:tRNA pseudouridine synthase n=1 Tax=Suhomyces tanzawaensis NRRL Y-17324 TaxID=984487 RepID=A0A1E4SMX3_9ASCO|nr:tRNA pseudouridine synthase [Suhomyces tanzawaensis NRRL Y-17324]ODV80845.1 tRNA pseudouridine synthase [Suhomyces tanzawaensis NRRL Y-17324]
MKEVPDYSLWTKEQLIKKIKELENVPTPKAVKKQKPFDFSKHNTRFVALKFAYLGWNYSGLAYQFEPTPKPTIESELLNAMVTAKLIEDVDPSACKFSRCGRTDKGVSAMNQVISLRLRSALTDEEQLLEENDVKELPYITILNSLLPSDIRVTAVCLRPPKGFDARFSCNYRHYRYLFKKDELDLELMNDAAKLYEGLHDFRHFCKIDGSKQITNYKRNIHSAKIGQLNEKYYYFDLKGSAFLWHQVRCMMAILFLIGQKLEPPSVITDLLDVERFEGKPHYEMANDIPLVLYDCSYDDLQWKVPLDIGHQNKHLKCFTNFKGIALDYQVKSNIVTIMEDIFLKDADKLTNAPGCGSINVGNGSGRNFTKYVKVEDKEKGQSYEVVNEKHKAKKQKKNQAAKLAAQEENLEEKSQ